MDTYLFSVYTSGIIAWDSLPRKQPYKIIGMTSSFVMLKGNREGLLQMKILKPHDGLIGALSYFIENKNLNLYFVCPFTMRLDVLGCSSAYQRSLKENGVLVKEYDLLNFLSIWRDRVQYLPDSSLQCSEVITNSCDLVMRSESPPPYDERCALSTIGITPDFHCFGVFDNEYSYSFQGFTRVNPTKLNKLRGNRTSLIHLPMNASMKLCLPLVQEMAKKLELQQPEPFMEDGRRVKCSLLLDEFAPSVDTRLLTPGNLDILGVLIMKPSEYFAWIGNAMEKYKTLESSVTLREAVFKSSVDFRFSPPAFMYQWKVFAFNSSTRINGTLPQSDWTVIVMNGSPLDYYKKSMSLYAINQVRNTGFFRGSTRFEYFNALERSMFKVPFPQTMTVKIYTCDVANQYERSLEKSLKDKYEDHFMATMGFLKCRGTVFPASEADVEARNGAYGGGAGSGGGASGGGASGGASNTATGLSNLSIGNSSSNTGTGAKWSEKLFNLRIRKTGGFIYSEFIEDCFEGFALESAKEILSCNPPDCCVCCTNKTNVVLEGCGHSYCLVCMTTMLETTTNQTLVVGGKVWESCPNCRAPFTKDSMIQFRAYKTTRRKSREDSSLTRKRALHYLLKGSEEKETTHFFIDKSPMVLDNDESTEPQEKEANGNWSFSASSSASASSSSASSASASSSSASSSSASSKSTASSSEPPFLTFKEKECTTLLVAPYDAAVEKLMEWCPGIHCVSLQKLSMMASWQKMTRIILVSPHMDLDALEKFHGILQFHTASEFSLEIISLNFGSSLCEDFSWTSSLAEAYGPHEKSISALVL